MTIAYQGGNLSLDVNLKLPAFFTTSLVYEAFGGSMGERAVLRTLKSIGAVEMNSKPMRVDPQILRDELPTIYHRCVEIILERRMRGEKPMRRRG